MVFQEESTFPWRTVLENVAFPLEIAGVSRSERRERAARFVSLVGLSGFERRYPSELSGGMRQRVAIARTLASQPRLLLMDEPFAALDEQTRVILGDKVLQIQQALRQTTLIITHNLTEAVQLSDRVLVMTYRPGPAEARRRHRAAASARCGRAGQRCIRPLRRADLAGPARRGKPRHRGGRGARPAARAMMASWAKSRNGARALGAASVLTSRGRRRGADPHQGHQRVHRSAAVEDRHGAAARHRRGARAPALRPDLAGGALGEPAARGGRHPARRRAVPLPVRTRSRTRRGSARWRRRRSC